MIMAMQCKLANPLWEILAGVLLLLALCSCDPPIQKSGKDPGPNPDPGTGYSLATDSVRDRDSLPLDVQD